MADAGAGKSAYELEREARIAQNRAKIAELGLQEDVAALKGPTPKKAPREKRKKPEVSVEDVRRSARPRQEVNYCEAEARQPGAPAEPKDYTERLAAVTLDEETAERLRQEMEAKRTACMGKSPVKTSKKRGPIDSGKGVRIQGGRVYDSAHGVTCHWCRQKTLEDHVTCTHPSCGGGKRMPYSFCHKCLKNRHGEDATAAEASGEWWCPCCRGSCGPGCVICCNCGPCRKKANLEPTHQIVKLARDAGFDNVHDYLVHLVTGETPDQLAARKLTKPWGAWMKEGGSDASEQTAGDAAAAEAGGMGEQQEEEEAVVQQQQRRGGRRRNSSGSIASDDVAAAARDQDTGAAGGSSKRGGTKREAGGAKGKPPRAQAAKRGGAAAAKKAAAAAEAAADDAGGSEMVLGSQQSEDEEKRARRLKRMQRLGLAAVEEGIEVACC